MSFLATIRERPQHTCQGIFSLTMTLRDWSTGNQHAELEKLEVSRVEAKSDICTCAWLGDIYGSLDASRHSPLLENNLPSGTGPEDWVGLAMFSAWGILSIWVELSE